MNINARQIDALDFNFLSQAETYQYSIDQLTRAKSSSAIMAKLSAEVGAWEAATQAFDSAFRKMTTTGQTKVVETLDAERDSIYTGFTGTVNSALKSPIAAQQQAAQQLQEPIKRYAISTTSVYQEQTMRTEQLSQDLLDNYQSQLAALGLTAWIEALQAKNQEFQAAMTQRTNDQAGYVKSELANLRLQIIATYRVFVKLMNVVLIYEGDTAYATVIDQMNAEVRHYRQIIARKGGTTPADNGGGTTSPDSSGGGGDNGGGTDTPGTGGDNGGGTDTPGTGGDNGGTDPDHDPWGGTNSDE